MIWKESILILVKIHVFLFCKNKDKDKWIEQQSLKLIFLSGSIELVLRWAKSHQMHHKGVASGGHSRIYDFTGHPTASIYCSGASISFQMPTKQPAMSCCFFNCLIYFYWWMATIFDHVWGIFLPIFNKVW